MTLTIFYDGTCPLCKLEMEQLRKFDTHQRLRLEDLSQPHFSQKFPYINILEANQILHALDSNGQLLLGLDATQASWNAVGKKSWVNLLRLPYIRPIADWCYLKFAKHRYSISWLLTGKKRANCEQCRLP